MTGGGWMLRCINRIANHCPIPYYSNPIANYDLLMMLNSCWMANYEVPTMNYKVATAFYELLMPIYGNRMCFYEVPMGNSQLLTM